MYDSQLINQKDNLISPDSNSLYISQSKNEKQSIYQHNYKDNRTNLIISLQKGIKLFVFVHE